MDRKKLTEGVEMVSIERLYEEESKLRKKLRDEWWLDEKTKKQIQERIHEIELERWKKIMRGDWW